MMDWSFLSPWLSALAPVIQLPRKNESLPLRTHVNDFSLIPRVDRFVVAPFEGIPYARWMRESASPRIAKYLRIRCAMEIVALALRVDPRVWGLLHDSKGDKLINIEEVDLDTLGAGIEFRFMQSDYRGADVPLSFFFSAVSEDLMGEYEATKQRIYSLDTSRRLANYRIPITINAMICFTFYQPSYAQVLCSIYESVYGRSLGDDGEVHITETAFQCRGLFVRMGVTSVEQIDRLNTLGIHVTHVVCNANDQEDTEALIKPVELTKENGESQPPISISHTLVRDPSLFGLFEAMSAGQRIGELVLTIKPTCDVTLLANIVPATFMNMTSLRRLEIDSPKFYKPRHLDVFESVLETVVSRRHHQLEAINPFAKGDVCRVLPSNVAEISFAVLPGPRLRQVQSKDLGIKEVPLPDQIPSFQSQLEVFQLTAKTEDAESARRLAKLVIKCLPRGIKSLALTIQAPGSCVVEGGFFVSMVDACRQVEMLKFDAVTVSSLSALVRVLDNNLCRIRSLELGDYGASVLPLLTALADPKTRVHHTLKELSLVLSTENTVFDWLLQSLEAMLTANRVLSS